MSFALELAKRNEEYIKTVASPDIGAPLFHPDFKKIMVVSCMDSRVEPTQFLKTTPGEVQVARVAGGRLPLIYQTLIASQTYFGLEELMVIHHTDCGNRHISNEDVKARILENPPNPHEPFGRIEWENFQINAQESPEQSLKDDVAWLRRQPLVKQSLKVTGWVYNVEDGSVKQVKL